MKPSVDIFPLHLDEMIMSCCTDVMINRIQAAAPWR